MARHVFLTGPPGIGKTTLIQKASEVLKSSGVPVDGFYTEEVRQGGRRVGFDVVTLSGLRGPLSRVGSEPPLGRRECRVGQYVVDLPAFEQLALPVLRNLSSGQIQIHLLRRSKGKRNAANEIPGRFLWRPRLQSVCHRRGWEDGALQSALHPGGSPDAVRPGHRGPRHHPRPQREAAGPGGGDPEQSRCAGVQCHQGEQEPPLAGHRDMCAEWPAVKVIRSPCCCTPAREGTHRPRAAFWGPARRDPCLPVSGAVWPRRASLTAAFREVFKRANQP
ncbi:cancer-related nucleoside-triphosphatase isoform X1 [Phyllostomus hastatus]|uniref:cancer-related nucleoside-triphosphatase isoform X1 n=1 Tax=Phyllostomus hastatus TaxID=9423 RepID=UPI001E6807DC|nr:cancer-related nucleoside-triphosphatase isoform X1 [Phyllostomus hastatus]